MSDERKDLKLYVVGESSGDPDEWIDLRPERVFVMAANAPEALSIADRGKGYPVSEVVARRACQIAVDRATNL